MQLRVLGQTPAQWLGAVPVVGGAASGFRDLLAATGFSSPVNRISSADQLAAAVSRDQPLSLPAGWNRPETRIKFSAADEQLLSGFRSRLQDLLNRSGIDSSSPLILEGDGFGGVTVANSHPQAAAINALIADDFHLSHWFQELQASAESQAGIPADSQSPFQIAVWGTEAVGRWASLFTSRI